MTIYAPVYNLCDFIFVLKIFVQYNLSMLL